MLRAISELPAVLALANRDVPVLLVLRVDEAERPRITDVITGWALGADASLDWLGANTVTLRTPRAPQLRLIDHGLADAAQRALTADAPLPLTRGQEARLREQARGGSAEAGRRLIDAYTELATLLAIWLRPETMSVERATRYAHEELDTIVARGPIATPLLVELVNRIANRL